jgi:threonine/homoserine/homoserine lactone efflux protein
MTASLLTGLGLGLFVAAQVGPVSLLCIRSVLRGSLATGLAIGLGAAVVDVAYASLGVAGTARLLTSPALRTWLGLGGAAVLVAMGARTLVSAWRVRLGLETPGEVATPGRALRTSLAATASNPLTIGSWAAIFAAASAASVATSTATTVSLLAGVGLGTLGWFTLLSLVLTVVRGRLGERGLRLVDLAAGLGLVGFGGLLGWRAATDGS